MELLEKKLNQYQLSSFLGLFFLGLVLLASFLAIAGLFYIWIIAVYITIGIIISTHFFLKNKSEFKIERMLLIVSLISANFIIFFSILTVPTIFSGRDQGSYSEAAIRLSQNHKLEFSTVASSEFFKIYGPGKALNFPGFNYTKDGQLTASFPCGYISWLSVFYSFFGLPGLVIANAVSFFIFLLSFYLLSRCYLKPHYAFLSYLFLITSFVSSWFFKYTLSENLALGIIFFGLYQIAIYLKNYQKIYFFSGFLSFLTLLFIKIEAFAFLAAAIFVTFLVSRKNKKIISFFSDKKIIIFFGAVFSLYLLNIFSGGSYYKTIAKALFHAVSGQGAEIVNSPNLSFEFFYTLKVLSDYALLGFIVLGICGFSYLLFQKKYSETVPFAILLPTFFYLLQPSISDDHPWMLRRFVFSVIPISIIYSVLFFDRYFKKRYFSYLLSFLLLLSNTAVFALYLTVSENKKMLSQIENISYSFKNNDLVLIDQMATGDGFSMMTGPMSFLYGKQTAYFINPEDVEKIDASKFNKIYFIIPDISLDFYEKSGLIKKLAPVKKYVIETSRLDVKIGKKDILYSEPVELPIEKNVAVYGKIYVLK